ncbi:MAG: undecaprenyl-phosphate glucose phosphotransferase [Candidatus Aminicenantes bacterium]|nr:undecaprenyl-phosphate glucose phosphotransferase [Candidatus Aminicenantes bacterium]
MLKRQRTRLIGLFLFSDILGILCAYFYSYFFRFYALFIPVDPNKGIPPVKDYIFVFFMFLSVHLVVFYVQGFYKKRLKRTRFDDFIFITLNAVATLAVCLAILSYLSNYSQGRAPLFRMTFKISHGFLAVYFFVFILLVTFFRNQIYFFMKRRYAKGLSLQNVLIIGAGEMGKAVAQKLTQYKDLGFSVKGFLDDGEKAGDKIDIDGGISVLGRLEELSQTVEQYNISDVYVALDLNNYNKILATLKVLEKHVVNIRLIPDLFQLLTLKASIQDLDGFPVISIDEPPLRGIMLILKRLIDFIVSLVLLILISPFLLLMALLVKLSSKGPVLYHQERMGLDGKTFTIHKFRTMISNAEDGTGPVMARRDDPRMTHLGRILRKFSIDELPQFINVLKGEMSLIGPRPERPHFVKNFKEMIPKYMLRHKVKSGITGWAQVHGLRQDTPIEKRLEYDFYYIQNWSISLDIKIIWLTLRKGFIDKTV